MSCQSRPSCRLGRIVAHAIDHRSRAWSRGRRLYYCNRGLLRLGWSDRRHGFNRSRRSGHRGWGWGRHGRRSSCRCSCWSWLSGHLGRECLTSGSLSRVISNRVADRCRGRGRNSRGRRRYHGCWSRRRRRSRSWSRGRGGRRCTIRVKLGVCRYQVIHLGKQGRAGGRLGGIVISLADTHKTRANGRGA